MNKLLALAGRFAPHRISLPVTIADVGGVKLQYVRDDRRRMSCTMIKWR